MGWRARVERLGLLVMSEPEFPPTPHLWPEDYVAWLTADPDPEPEPEPVGGRRLGRRPVGVRRHVGAPGRRVVVRGGSTSREGVGR